MLRSRADRSRLPRAARVLLGGDALCGVGTGLTWPFLIVYLHHVRGIALAEAGLVVTLVALASLVANPLAGALCDRLGARRVLVAGLLIAAAGSLCWTQVRSPASAALAALVFGAGTGTMLPAADAALADSVPRGERSRVFALRHALLNSGLGTGSVLAALILASDTPARFELVYLLDAVSYAGFALLALLVAPSATAAPAPAQRREAAARRGGYHELARDRALLGLCAISMLFVAAGFAQYYAAFPTYAAARGVDARTLALLFAANTLTVICAQLPVLRLASGRRRSRLLALAGLLVATAWVLALAAGGADPASTRALLVGWMMLLGLAETLVSPALAPLVNELAREELRGRYNAAQNLAWTSGMLAGPPLAAAAVAAGHAAALMTGFALACLAVSAGALRLERFLSAGANRIPAARRHAAGLELVGEAA
jgi:MFS family permease